MITEDVRHELLRRLHELYAGWMRGPTFVRGDVGVREAYALVETLKRERVVQGLPEVPWLSEVRFEATERGRLDVLLPYEFEPVLREITFPPGSFDQFLP